MSFFNTAYAAAKKVAGSVQEAASKALDSPEAKALVEAAQEKAVAVRAAASDAFEAAKAKAGELKAGVCNCPKCEKSTERGAGRPRKGNSCKEVNVSSTGRKSMAKKTRGSAKRAASPTRKSAAKKTRGSAKRPASPSGRKSAIKKRRGSTKKPDAGGKSAGTAKKRSASPKKVKLTTKGVERPSARALFDAKVKVGTQVKYGDGTVKCLRVDRNDRPYLGKC